MVVYVVSNQQLKLKFVNDFYQKSSKPSQFYCNSYERIRISDSLWCK